MTKVKDVASEASRRGWLPAPLASGLFLALALVLGSAAVAVAEKLPSPTEPEAKAHLIEGNKAYQLKDFEVAIREYRAGAALASGSKTTYTFWWNLAQSYRMSGKYEDAIWFYRQFLNQAPLSVPLHRDAAQKFITEMQAELDRAASKSEPSGPAPVDLEKGTEDPSSASAPPARPAAIDLTPAREPWHADKLGWGLGVGGVVLTAAGVGLMLNGASLQQDANGESRQSARRDLRDTASSRTLIGRIGGGVGLALLATGVIKLAMTDAPVVSL
jgi:tetratricopeptide (TPR) repeat protein